MSRSVEIRKATEQTSKTFPHPSFQQRSLLSGAKFGIKKSEKIIRLYSSGL